MELCLNSQRCSVQRILVSSAYILLGAIFVFWGVGALIVLIREALTFSGIVRVMRLSLSILVTAFVVLWGIVYFRIGYRIYFVYSRKYSVTVSGITVHYCNSTVHEYRWEEFEDISLCDVDQNYGGGFDLVIRLATEKDQRGPLQEFQKYSINGYEKWRSGTYILKYYQDVIYIGYSKERYDIISNCCKREIVDRRTKLGKTVII